nr:hypothetical protein BAU18_03955 [Enterococcus diestrammenae]
MFFVAYKKRARIVCFRGRTSRKLDVWWMADVTCRPSVITNLIFEKKAPLFFNYEGKRGAFSLTEVL